MGGWRNHYAPPTDFVGFELGKKSRRIETESGVEMALRPGGRISLIGLVNYGRLRYDADESYEGASLQQNLNRNITIYGGEVQVAMTPLSSLGASVNYYTDRFLYAPERDGNGLRYMVGVPFQPLALISGRAEVGYMNYKPVRDPSRLRRSGVQSRAVVRPGAVLPRRLRPANHRVQLRSERASTCPTASTSTGGRARGAARWEAFGRGPVRGMEPRGLLALQEPFRALELYKGGLVRRFGEILRIGADIERYVTGGPGGFDGVRATVFIVLGGSTRLQRLDRPLPGGLLMGKFLGSFVGVLLVAGRRVAAPPSQPPTGSARATSSRSRSGRSPS